jgi:catechol 2,3-dioxygenase-like lactoylglutathione lyase family enzyme
VPVQRLNHAVLFVRDVDRSADFYRDVLGFRVKVEMPGRAVFLQAEGSTNDHDLGLFAVGAAAGPSGAGRSTVGLYHLAWEVDTLAELARIRGSWSRPAPWPGRRITPPPRRCTPRTPTASSSRSPGCCPPT